jgi:hypothetical protein
MLTYVQSSEMCNTFHCKRVCHPPSSHVPCGLFFLPLTSPPPDHFVLLYLVWYFLEFYVNWIVRMNSSRLTVSFSMLILRFIHVSSFLLPWVTWSPARGHVACFLLRTFAMKLLRMFVHKTLHLCCLFSWVNRSGPGAGGCVVGVYTPF